MPDFSADKARAIEWAKGLLAEAEADPRAWVIFDTETTGLPQDEPEIVQIGLLWPDGTVAMDTLVRPWMDHKPEGKRGIPGEATAIHGITDHAVMCAPCLSELLGSIAEIIHGRKVIVYNRAYDFEVLLQCLYRRWKDPDAEWQIWSHKADRDAKEAAYEWLNKASSWHCAMEEYAQFCGEWNYRKGGYRWQRLQGGDHTAIGDCRATLSVIKKMAGV